MTNTTVRVPFEFGKELEGQESAETLKQRINRAMATKDYPAARRDLQALAARFPDDPMNPGALARLDQLEEQYRMEMTAMEKVLRDMEKSGKLGAPKAK
jgi:outer membrane protein assembly factor BamD (BamD/ComL family)